MGRIFFHRFGKWANKMNISLFIIQIPVPLSRLTIELNCFLEPSYDFQLFPFLSTRLRLPFHQTVNRIFH